MTTRFTFKAVTIAAIAALVFAIAGCGAERATDQTQAPAPDGDQQWLEIAVVHAPSIGQAPAPGPVLIENRQQIRSYSTTFGGSAGQMRKDIKGALATAEIPDGWRSVAAVVSVGCLAPESIDLQDGQLVANVDKDKIVTCAVAHAYVVVIAAAPEVADELLATAAR